MTDELITLECGCQVYILMIVPGDTFFDGHHTFDVTPKDRPAYPTGEVKYRCSKHEYPIKRTDDAKLISDAWKKETKP